MKPLRATLWLAFLAFLATALLLASGRHGVKIHDGASCNGNLRRIQLAKLMYAENHDLTNGASFTKEQLLP